MIQKVENKLIKLVKTACDNISTQNLNSLWLLLVWVRQYVRDITCWIGEGIIHKITSAQDMECYYFISITVDYFNSLRVHSPYKVIIKRNKKNVTCKKKKLTIAKIFNLVIKFNVAVYSTRPNGMGRIYLTCSLQHYAHG